ncbi:hypothetical protein [Microbacterium sp. EST19A]|uniref:hypothetical protein n=1 Tax=Microbacterium sp. EST19A TaxID=2862681 RepID=UPI001CBF8404|nr:hypothetical protein [Microbacterium sp. EST19A]
MDPVTEHPPQKRPVVISIVVVLVVLSGLSNALLGLTVLLSRYQVPDGDVMVVSLIGAGVILFGLLTLAVAGGIRRGSRGARLLVTIYLGIQLVLHVVTALTTAWDWAVFVQTVVELLVLVAVWAPPSSRRFFTR